MVPSGTVPGFVSLVFWHSVPSSCPGAFWFPPLIEFYYAAATNTVEINTLLLNYVVPNHVFEIWNANTAWSFAWRLWNICGFVGTVMALSTIIFWEQCFDHMIVIQTRLHSPQQEMSGSASATAGAAQHHMHTPVTQNILDNSREKTQTKWRQKYWKIKTHAPQCPISISHDSGVHKTHAFMGNIVSGFAGIYNLVAGLPATILCGHPG